MSASAGGRRSRYLVGGEGAPAEGAGTKGGVPWVPVPPAGASEGTPPSGEQPKHRRVYLPGGGGSLRRGAQVQQVGSSRQGRSQLYPYGSHAQEGSPGLPAG